MIIINVYTLLSILGIIGFFLINYCGVKSFNPVTLQHMFSDAKSWAKALNALLLLMKNSGVILCSITLGFLFFLSLFNHAFESNFLSYFAMVAIVANFIYVFVIDANYHFYDAKYLNVFGLRIPELDVIVLITLTPLLVLYIVNSLFRR